MVGRILYKMIINEIKLKKTKYFNLENVLKYTKISRYTLKNNVFRRSRETVQQLRLCAA